MHEKQIFILCICYLFAGFLWAWRSVIWENNLYKKNLNIIDISIYLFLKDQIVRFTYTNNRVLIDRKNILLSIVKRCIINDFYPAELYFALKNLSKVKCLYSNIFLWLLINCWVHCMYNTSTSKKSEIKVIYWLNWSILPDLDAVMFNSMNNQLFMQTSKTRYQDKLIF